MGVIGKIIGGTIGFALGGPLGAILGAAFGHAFDAGQQLEDDDFRLRVNHTEQAQLTFFVGVFSMLAKLVKVDGKVSRAEVDSIDRFMVYELHLDGASRQHATRIFQAALNSPEPFERFATQFYQQFYTHPQLLELMIDIMLRVAVADGSMSSAEERLIVEAARIFHFSTAKYEMIKARYIKDVEKYYAVLDCRSSDSDDQIKKQYRKLVREYHPDTIISKGLPEEFTKLAEAKFREIQQAYEKIKDQRGMK